MFDIERTQGSAVATIGPREKTGKRQRYSLLRIAYVT